jgi:hypothetical protein
MGSTKRVRRKIRKRGGRGIVITINSVSGYVSSVDNDLTLTTEKMLNGVSTPPTQDTGGSRGERPLSFVRDDNGQRPTEGGERVG